MKIVNPLFFHEILWNASLAVLGICWRIGRMAIFFPAKLDPTKGGKSLVFKQKSFPSNFGLTSKLSGCLSLGCSPTLRS